MKIITRATLAAEAAERWKRQYFLNETKGWGKHPSHDREATYNALLASGPQPNPDEVDRIIGNKAWTMVPCCNECEKEQAIVAQMGEPLDYESRTAFLCRDCLGKAILAMHRWPEPLPPPVTSR